MNLVKKLDNFVQLHGQYVADYRRWTLVTGKWLKERWTLVTGKWLKEIWSANYSAVRMHA